jgi:glutamate 5-kinase
MLLTNDDFSDRRRFLNSRNTCFSILNYDVIPILNENDAITVDEIKVGDNDTLSALVVSLIDADLLIILSDIDGLYDSNPAENKDANLISIVPEITSKIKQMSGKSNSKFGTGGMATKIKCAEIATTTGADMIIARSDIDHVITRIVEGEKIGTLFMKRDKNITSRKHWIGYSSKISGKLTIDSGAVKAIYNKKSLLPSGIVSVEGDFSHSDTVSIVGENGEVYANGITYYSSSEIKKILGKASSEIEKLLGYKDFDEVIHVNNLVIIKEI